MDARKPIGRSSQEYLWLVLLVPLVLIQFGCAPTSVYVPVAGDRVEFNPGNVKTVSPLTTSSSGDERQPCVSPDGKYVAMVSRPQGKKSGRYFNNEVYVMDAEGGNLRPITNLEGVQDVLYPYWMKGDSQLMYTRYDGFEGFPRSIYVHDFPPKGLDPYSVLGREQMALLGGSFVWSGCPSPDGKKVALCVEMSEARKTRFRPNIFVRQPQLENPVIMIFDMATKQARRFASGSDPSWSPDGKNVAYTQRRGDNWYIYVKNVESNEERQVTSGTDALDWTPCWSPSGSALAFTSWRAKDWDIWKVDADGTNLQQLTNSKGTEWDPSWGPGGYIYFSFLRTGQDWDIWRLQVHPPSWAR